jgi:hypothetical protein
MAEPCSARPGEIEIEEFEREVGALLGRGRPY